MNRLNKLVLERMKRSADNFSEFMKLAAEQPPGQPLMVTVQLHTTAKEVVEARLEELE